MTVFENPHRLRAELDDARTGKDTARYQDRFAFIGADRGLYTHPSKDGAERLAEKPNTEGPTAANAPVNLHRAAARIEGALMREYLDATDSEELIRWALADLRHLADHHGLAFAKIDRAAHELYRAELSDGSGAER